MAMNNGEANWLLPGEAIVAFVHRSPALKAGILPAKVHRVPGPVVILAERFDDSPVGPFMALSIGEPTRMGLRLGFHFYISVLSVPAARVSGRLYWGYPHEVGTLRWSTEPGGCSMVWEERKITINAKTHRRPLPILVPMRTFQQRNDGPVMIQSRVRGLLRRAKVDIDVDGAGDFKSLEGSHRGVYLSAMRLRRFPARHPSGLLSSFRAPLRGTAEPGVIGMERAFDRSSDSVGPKSLRTSSVPDIPVH